MRQVHRHQAEWMRKYRERARLTQDEVSKALEFSSGQFISNVERGIRPIPDDLISKIAAICRCSTVTLIDSKIKDYREHLEAMVLLG